VSDVHGTATAGGELAAQHPVQDLVPDEDQIFGWIEEIFGQGIRRPGSPADRWCVQWVADRFAHLGLDVHLEPVEVPVWEPDQAEVTMWPTGQPDQAVTVAAFALPYTSPSADLQADVALVTAATDDTGAEDGTTDTTASVAGRIALEHVELMQVPQHLLRDAATAVHDPDGDFDHLIQTLPFGVKVADVIQPAVDAGAAGFIGVLSGMPWETRDYYVPYDAVDRDIPAVWVSRDDGAKLTELTDAGPVQARIHVRATRRIETSHTVFATLSGPTEQHVLIGSHHDGPWA
jgi:hypothetical protein